MIDKISNLLRKDGWSNLLTGLGTKGIDKRLSSDISWSRMDEITADSLYSGDDIMPKIVDQLPEDAFREGYEVDDKQVKTKFDLMKVDNHVLTAWKWARKYGGSAILYLTNAQDLSLPMSDSEQVRGLIVLSKWELIITSSDIDYDIMSPNFGFPNTYRIQMSNSGAGTVMLNQRIHYSRLERFHGAELSRRQFFENNFWHDSVMNRVLNAVRNYQTAHDSSAAIIQDFNVGVWKMKNLAELVGSGKEDQIRSRISLVNLSKGVLKSIILDDSESYEDKSRTVTGLPELITKVGERLVAATNIPHTILLGESPSGSNATGNSTTMGWYDYVASQQKSYLTPHLIAVARKLGAKKDPVFKYRPLWQMDDKETAETRKLQAETDQINYNIGALDSEEIRASRFGGDEYSFETQLIAGAKPEPKAVATPFAPAPAPVVKTDAEKKTRIQTLIFSKQAFKSAVEAAAWLKEHNFEMKKPADETDESYRFRQVDPESFDKNSFRTIELKHGVSAVVGHMNDEDVLIDPDPSEDDGDDKEATGGTEE